jgi:tetratricopeptide (TPR) repeat protein
LYSSCLRVFVAIPFLRALVAIRIFVATPNLKENCIFAVLMRLNKTQIGVILVIVALSVVLYLLPKKVLTNKKEGANRDKAQTETSGETETATPSKSLTLILTESMHGLSEQEKAEVSLTDSSSEKEVSRVLEAYKKLDNKLGIALCLDQLKNSTPKDLGLAYYEAFNQSKVEDNRKAIATKVISLLQPVSREQPNDLDVQCALADCYVNATEAPMNGISILRDIVAKDSTNEKALYLLGVFSVKSGQTDKAIDRFERLVRLYPANMKYSLYLAQLFSDHGDPGKARETLITAKKYAVRKSAQDSLNNIINQLK